MLGFLAVARLVVKATPVGMVLSSVGSAMYTLDFIVAAAQKFELVNLESLGVNRQEEKHHQKAWGGTEPYFPFKLEKDSFPDGMEQLIGDRLDGKYIWRLSEWNDLSRWFSALIQNRLAAESGDAPRAKVGRDGLWLLEVGRRRWKEKEWKKRAFAALRAHPDLVEGFDFILREQEVV